MKQLVGTCAPGSSPFTLLSLRFHCAFASLSPRSHLDFKGGGYPWRCCSSFEHLCGLRPWPALLCGSLALPVLGGCLGSSLVAAWLVLFTRPSRRCFRAGTSELGRRLTPPPPSLALRLAPRFLVSFVLSCSLSHGQDFEPRMHVADSDFRELTRGKALNEAGELGPEVFEQIIREQIRLYTQVRFRPSGSVHRSSRPPHPVAPQGRASRPGPGQRVVRSVAGRSGRHLAQQLVLRPVPFFA
jgi:hypothetical protein